VRCKKCDYPLWTIAARSCPECGEAFKPSDFDFRRGAVKFCCPHCRQEYYGTSARGQLEPRDFDCVRCGTHVSMDEMVLEPADAGALDSAVMGAGKINPWLDRGGSNVVAAWFRGAGMLLSAPRDFGATVPANAPVGSALGFAAIGVLILTLGSLLCAVPMYSFMLAGVGPGGPATSQLLGMIAWVAFQPLIVAAIVVGTCACVCHAILLVTGGTEHGFGRTLQVMLYAEGATSLLSIIPCLGQFSRIWWVVLAALLLMRMQRVSGGRAALATVPPILIPIAIVVALVLMPSLLIGGPMGAGIATTTVGTTYSAATADGQTFANALAGEARVNGAVWATTPLDAVADGTVSGETLLALVAPDGTSTGIGSALQSDIMFGASNENVRTAAKELAAKLPPNDAPFRIGQAVFAYRGIPETALSNGLTGSLWLVIVLPTPSDQSPQSSRQLLVFTEWAGLPIEPEEFQARLDEQNQLRASLGLPAIPPLETMPDLRGVQ
jgi:hypothetical protein